MKGCLNVSYNIAGRNTQKKPTYISEYEFKITKMLLDALCIDCESDYTITYNSCPLWSGSKLIGYTERYSSIPDVPKELSLFRPLRFEKHANILIDMFTDSEEIPVDALEIQEYIENDRKFYKGYFVYKGTPIENGTIEKARTPSVLKTSVVAKLLLDDMEYLEFTELLKKYFNRGKSHDTVE